MNWYLAEKQAALSAFQSDERNGLASTEAEARLARHGPNELLEKGGRTPLRIVWEQLTATMVLILISAAIVALFLGDDKNATAILAIVVLYTAFGFIQEYRAERAIAALKRMSVPNVRVFRDGALTEISARALAPGDILQLEAGNVVPADGRLLEAFNLRVQESAVTGESESVLKQTAVLSGGDVPLGDRTNMVYMGTMVTHGRAAVLVTATGMNTELGRIADLLQQTASGSTPLQRRLDHLGKLLAVIGFAIAALIFVLGILRGDDLRHMLLTAVSVAVAIVPEGLPAVVTITLAFGAQRMLQRNALVRRLPAVETLGSVTVICSDKTGTLTENRMTVVVMDVAEHVLDLTESMDRAGAAPTLLSGGLPAQSPLSLLAVGAALCNDAALLEQADGRCRAVGDPTEAALLAAAARMGYRKQSLDRLFPRVAELPFDSERKRMTTVHRLSGRSADSLAGLEPGDNAYVGFTKGSVDGLLTISAHVWLNGKTESLDARWRKRIESANEQLAKKGMRVLGVAYRLRPAASDGPQAELESGLTFIGLFGMLDPPRSEVKDAIALTRSAGIRTVMITGDHPLTAAEIARQLDISDGGRV
jgi:Ca2+-transporting ATPase